MMFLGNTDALAVSNEQLKRMKETRVLTVAMMSMSSISCAIVDAYVSLITDVFVLSAISLNIIYSIRNEEIEKQPFFSFLGDSVLNAGKLILIIIAFVISFVALSDLIDRFINLITGIIGGWAGIKGSFGLDQILGTFMYPFA